MRAILLLVLLIGFTVVAGAGDSAPYATPAVGSALRKQLMDTLRIPAEEHLGQAVVFKVSALRVMGDWAFSSAPPSSQTAIPWTFGSRRPTAKIRAKQNPKSKPGCSTAAWTRC